MNTHFILTQPACGSDILWPAALTDSYRAQGQSLRVSNCDFATASLESFVTSVLSWLEHRIRATGVLTSDHG